MWALLKSFPFVHYIVIGAIGLAVWVYGDLILTKQALEDQRELTAQYQHIAETQAAIQERDAIIVRVSDEADRAIQEAPNADTPIPPDVASAWAAGIDSVRDAGTKPTDGHDVPRPRVDAPKPRGADSGGTSTVLEGPGSSVLEM